MTIVELKAGYKAVWNNLREVGGKKYAIIPVEMLYVDPAFQRITSRSREKIASLAANWNPNKMDALKTVPHPETGQFSVVDGYGRLKASQMLSTPYEAIECEVITEGVPEDPQERQKFEARLFAEQMKQVEQLKPAQLHNANVLLGNKDCMILEEACKAYGVKICSTSGRRRLKTLGSYTDALTAVQRGGKECIEFIFDVLGMAGYDLEANGYASYFLNSLMYIYLGHKNNCVAVKEAIEGYLKLLSPTVFKAEAIAKYPKRHVRIAVTLYLEDILVELYGIKRKIKINESGRVEIAA